MATVYWLGIAEEVAQVTTVQVTGFDANTTYSITIGDAVASVAGNASANQTAADLQGAVDALTHPHGANTTITATVSTDTVTLTAVTAGVPFVATSSVDGGTGTIGNATTTTANAGPNVWSTASNWSDGAAPDGSDDVVIPANSPNIAWLPSSAQTINSLTIERGANHIGLDRTRFATSADGATYDSTAREYRQTYLPVSTATIRYGTGSASTWAAKRHLVNNSLSGASVLEVASAPTSSADSTRDAPALRYLAAHADADVYVRGSGDGGVGIAMDAPGETSTIGDVLVSATGTAARVRTSNGVTLTSWTQSGGANEMRAASAATPTATCTGGTLTIEGVFVLSSLDAPGGTVTDNHTASSGNSTTVGNITGGTLDLQGTKRARQYGTLNYTKGGLKDDPSVTLLTYNRPRATCSA